MSCSMMSTTLEAKTFHFWLSPSLVVRECLREHSDMFCRVTEIRQTFVQLKETVSAEMLLTSNTTNKTESDEQCLMILRQHSMKHSRYGLMGLLTLGIELIPQISKKLNVKFQRNQLSNYVLNVVFSESESLCSALLILLWLCQHFKTNIEFWLICDNYDETWQRFMFSTSTFCHISWSVTN